MRKIYTLVFALMVLLSVTMSAAALESKTISRQNGNAAVASWSNIATDGTIFTDLSVTKTKVGTDIMVSICKQDLTGNYTCKFGFNSFQQDIFSIDKKLTTATLSPVKVDLFNPDGTVETITIQTQWTGFGDLATNTFKFMSKSGGFIEKFSDSSTIREATAVGSINEQDLGTSAFGELIAFKSASMSMQK
jgi:hypothetical protein